MPPYAHHYFIVCCAYRGCSTESLSFALILICIMMRMNILFFQVPARWMESQFPMEKADFVFQREQRLTVYLPSPAVELRLNKVIENIRILNGWTTSPLVPNVINGDPLRLANAKDTLMLYENGVLVQEVAWPDDIKPREGQIHYLEKGAWDPPPAHDRAVPFLLRSIPEMFR